MQVVYMTALSLFVPSAFHSRLFLHFQAQRHLEPCRLTLPRERSAMDRRVRRGRGGLAAEQHAREGVGRGRG